jgi:hypothetical protein
MTALVDVHPLTRYNTRTRGPVTARWPLGCRTPLFPLFLYERAE